MEGINEILKTLEQHYPSLQKKYPLKSMGVYGSYVRGDARPDSDIDILVEFSEPVGWEIVDLVMELEAQLGKKVDLVSKKAVKARMLPYIEKDLVYVAA